MKSVKKTVRHYWKYQYDAWTQPHNMTSNGVLGGSDFACWQDTTSQKDFYHSINNDGYSYMWANAKNNAEFILYNPIPLKITQMVWTVADSNRNPTNYTVQGSNDGTTYTNIITNQTASAGSTTTMNLSVNTESYKYYKILVNSFNTGSGNCMKFDITAQQKVSVPATQDDYDFYTDDEVVLLPKISDKFYGINQ